MADKHSKQNEDVIAYTAAHAALRVKGVGALCNAPISFSLRSKEKYRGVVMSSDEKTYSFDLYININYGSKIPQTAFAVQEAVKKAVESIAEKEVLKVNIHVLGIDFRQLQKA